ncbi:hypothetical protein [Reichenbachiella sp.]
MKRLIVWLSAFLVCAIVIGESHAQSFRMNLSPKHQKKLNNTKDYRKKLTRYHKYYAQDSTALKKAEKRNYKKKLDSLAQVDFERNKLYGQLATIQSNMDLDTTVVTFEHLKQVAGDHQVYAEELQQLEALEQVHRSTLMFRDSVLRSEFKLDSLMLRGDSSSMALAEQMVVSRLSSMAGEEYSQVLSQRMGSVDDYAPEQAAQWKDLEGLTTPSPKDLSDESVNNLSDKQNAKLKETQSKMKLDKLKYAEIGDSKDMNTAVKKTSLKEVSFKKRLDLGGNFQIASTDPFVIELSPQIGYFINKKWTVGLGLNYRTTIGASDSLSKTAAHGYGYQLFSSYDILKNLFLYSEFNRTKQDRLFGEKNELVDWKNAFMIGLGLSLKVSSKVDARIMLLYDVSKQSEQKFLGQPVVLKFGFRLSEIGRHELARK